MSWTIQGKQVVEPTTFEQATESFVKYKGVLTRLDKKLLAVFNACKQCRTFEEGIFRDLNVMWKEYSFKVKFLETYNERRNDLAMAEDTAAGQGVLRADKDTTRAEDCGNDYKELANRSDQMYNTYMELRILMLGLRDELKLLEQEEVKAFKERDAAIRFAESQEEMSRRENLKEEENI